MAEAPLRVLLVTNDFPPDVGGVQSYLFELYRRLAEADVRVTVIAPKREGWVEADARMPANMQVIRRRQVAVPTPGLRRQVKQLAADADVICTGSTLPMVSVVRGLGKPIMMHTAGLEVTLARVPLLKRYLKSLMAPADRVSVLTAYTARALRDVLPGEPLRLPAGVDLDAFPTGGDGALIRRRYGLGDRPVVTVVCRLVPRKGVDELIRILPALRARVPGATLLVAGGGPDHRRLEGLAAAHRLPFESVVFTGELPHEDLPHVYAAGDVFAMPCRTRWSGLEVEGFGLVYLEAQACERPVVVGSSGGAPETIRPGETGVVVDGRDRPAMLSVLSRMLSDPVTAREMGRKGREFVRAEFDIQLIAGDLLAALREITRV